MQVTAMQVTDIVREVWQTFLMIDVEQPPTKVNTPLGGSVASFISMSGSWRGIIVLRTSATHARTLASRMLEIEDPDLCADDVQDVLGELINCVGGNLQEMIAGPTQLSMPIVIEGASYDVALPREQVFLTVPLISDGQLIDITIASQNEELFRCAS